MSRFRDPRLAGAIASGVLLALAFPPFDVWPLAFCAIAALTLLTRDVRPARAARIGFGFGLGFFVVLLRWLHVIGYDAVLALAALEAAFLIPVAMAFALLSRRRDWWVWQPVVWVAGEALRARQPFGGLPWGRLAFAQADSPLAPLMAWAGAPGVTFAVAAGGCAVAVVVVAVRRLQVIPAVLAAGVFAGVLGAGALAPEPDGATPSLTVAVVQGNVPRPALTSRVAQQEAVFANHVGATHALAEAVRGGRARQPDLVIWPENSSDVDPFNRPDVAMSLNAVVDDIGAPTLVGAVLDAGPQYVRNAGILWNPGTGAARMYTKRHPVPFGEYLPMRPILEKLISRFSRIPRDFEPGRDPGVLDTAGTRIGGVICFEVAYDRLVRDVVRDGGRLLVVQTNNATYGRTGQPEQQLAIERLRAREHGRDMVVAATSGISAVLRADGSVAWQSGQFVDVVGVRQVALHSRLTPATRVGGWPELVLTLLGLIGIVTHRPGRRSTREGLTRSTVKNEAVDSQRSADATTVDGTAIGGEALTDKVTTAQPITPVVSEESSPGTILVLIPTYNEAQNLAGVLERLATAVPDAHVLVLDDNSPDGTGQIADEIAARDPRVNVLHRPGKAGLGAAYLAGFEWGLERGYSALVEMDADGSHRPEDLPRLIAALPEADLVLGSRWVPGGSVVNWPRSRRILSRGGTGYANLVLRLGIRDATGGFRVFRRETLEGLELAGVASQGYCFQIDLAARAVERGFRVVEVPITFVERELGASKMSRSIVFEALWRVTLWGLTGRRRRGKDAAQGAGAAVGSATRSR